MSHNTPTTPLSYGQQRLWFLAQLAPDSLAYHRPWAIQIRGDLDVDALQAALAEIVCRHDVLRSTIVEVDDLPRRAVSACDSFRLPLVEVRDRPGSTSDWKALAHESASRHFDLAHEPPFRPELLRITADEHILLLTTHHIGFDAWSERILLKELEQFYHGGLRGEKPALPRLRQTYADYVRWQRRLAKSGAFKADLDYFEAQWDGAADSGRLAADSLALERGKDGVGVATLSMAKAVAEAVRTECRKLGVTPFMVFSAGLTLVLARSEDTQRVTIGYPIAGRTMIDHEGLIGLFVNTLPLTLTFTPGMQLDGLLEQTRRRSLEGALHQAAPFERIVDRIRPPRSVQESPLFNVVLNFRNLPVADINLEGLQVSNVDLQELEARYDFSLQVAPSHDRFEMRAVYPEARISDERARDLLDQLNFVLEQLTGSSVRQVRGVSLIPPAHRPRLPDPALRLPRPAVPGVLERFLVWTTRTPNAPAVVHPGGVVTYAGLRSLVAAEADVLRGTGVGTGDVVALAGSVNLGRVVGTLAAFLCGAVVQPLDSRRRLGDQIRELELAGTRLVALYGEDCGDTADDLPKGVSVLGRPDIPVQSVGDGDQLGAADRPDEAYIFFTSGSTGPSKPILGSLQALSHIIEWQSRTFGLAPGDRGAIVNNPAFDISMRDLFAPLASGSSVCIPDAVNDLESGRVLAWLAKSRVTFVHLVPSIARFWVAQDEGGSRLDRLRLTSFGGEPLTSETVDRWRQLTPDGAQIVNLYGPSEAAHFKTWYSVPDPPAAGIQPIGWELPETQILIRAEDGSPCGFGEPGELVIRTPFLSYGYMGQAEGRGAGFILNSLSGDPNDLVFPTGDVGKRRADGAIEYLGRADRQAKIHGVRVDLGQLEAALGRTPAVEQSVVNYLPSESGAIDLIAYVVPAGGNLDVEALRQSLRAQLPPDLVPRRWVVLDHIPLTSSGKLDLAALPTPADEPRQNAAKAPPANDLERALQRIWRDALNVGEIGVTEDYFDLGGHSLLALQIFAAMEKRLGVRLPISSLFEAPTIRQLAARIEEDSPAPTRGPLVAVQPNGDRLPIFWVHAAGGHVLSYRHLARRLGDDQPFYALEGRPPATPAEFRTLEEMARQYVDEIRKLQPRGPYQLGGLSFGGLVAWEMARQFTARGEEVSFLGILDTRSVNKSREPHTRDARYLLRERIEYHRGQIAMRPRSEWVGYVGSRAKLMLERIIANLLGPWAPDLARALAPTGFEVTLAMREADAARRDYEIQPFPGKLTVFRASVQPSWSQDPTLGWSDYALGGVDVRQVPGTHVSLISEPNLGILSAEVRRALKAAQSRDSSA